MKKIHEGLGLDRVKVALSGGAAIHINTVEFFLGIDLPILDMYGMTESTGPQTTTTINKWRIGSVGQPIDGTHLKVLNPNENGEGEVSDASCVMCFV